MSHHSETLVIGAGPAGLTAAYLLTKAGRSVTVLEKDPAQVGGISRTVELNGFRFDIGGRDSDDLLMHAERAEIVVNTTDDTMLIRFHNVTAAATDGGLTEQPVVVTSAWPLRVDAIDDSQLALLEERL